MQLLLVCQLRLLGTGESEFLMPSPILHTTMGYVVYKIVEPDSSKSRFGKLGRIPVLLIISIVASLLPDLDSVFGILAGDFGRYHNNATHSLFVGLLVALLFAGGISVLFNTLPFRTIFLVTLLSYQAHIVFDYFTVSRGVMALWPFSHERFVSPISLFYGFHWSDGLFSIRHLWTFLTESVQALILVLMVNHLTSRKFKRSDLERGSRIVTRSSEEH
jgi:membrane-bound metal-dependent hydrolase YbcI (DUF457 family)